MSVHYQRENAHTYPCWHAAVWLYSLCICCWYERVWNSYFGRLLCCWIWTGQSLLLSSLLEFEFFLRYKLPDHSIIFARWCQHHKNGRVTLVCHAFLVYYSNANDERDVVILAAEVVASHSTRVSPWASLLYIHRPYSPKVCRQVSRKSTHRW